MPIYEYRCQDCHSVFETIVFSSSAKVACPGCGAERVERQPSTFGIAGTGRPTSGGAGCGGCKKTSCAGCH
ncbi:MAG: zinc ribbon domain-containing protein [Vicinamibacterales bacterium]